MRHDPSVIQLRDKEAEKNLSEDYRHKTIPVSNQLQLLALNDVLDLVLQCGEETIWTEFVHRCQPFIARVIAKTLRRCTGAANASLVDDLIQETYLKLFARNSRALREFQCEHETALYGFMKRVASNVVHDYLRDVWSRKHGSGKQLISIDLVMNEVGSSKPATQLQRYVLLQEIVRRFTKGVARTDFTREHTVFCLYYEQGFTAGEISGLSHLGLTVKGVESMIFRLARDLKT